VKNAVIAPGLYYLAQFIVSIPFNFIAALVFQSTFHWLTNINPNGEVFIYSTLICWGHLLLMEGLMFAVVQALGNAMLSITFAIVVLGALFLYSGFFIDVPSIAHWIRWLCYLIPTKYSLDGYLHMIFHGQTFLVSGSDNMFITGDQVLKSVYRQEGVKPWPMFLVLLAWVALVRVSHCLAFLFEVMPFLSKPKRMQYSTSK
jgi:hypothetical protein